MSIWNKILLGFIFLGSVAFFYMAARTLKTRQVWMSAQQGFEAALAAEKQLEEELRNGVVVDGEVTEMGIRQVRHELHKLMLDRGRIWTGVMPVPGQVDAQTGAAVVAVGTPDPHQIREKMILFVFEEEESRNGGQYLGEFKVDSLDEAQKQVMLKPTFNLTRALDGQRLDEARLARLAASQGPWTLYERMPPDNHEIFAELSDEELAEFAPPDRPELMAEYLKHGKPAEDGDPEDAEGNFVRELVDYELLFRFIEVERSELVDLIQADQRDRDSINDTLADAKLETEHHKKLQGVLTTEKDQFVRERDAAIAHLQEVDTRLADTQGKVQSAISSIQSWAAEIARIQLEATRRINAQTRALMQAGAGQ